MEQTPELHRNPEAASEMAANAVINYLRQLEIVDREERRLWIAKVFDAVRAREDLAN